MKTYLDCYPCFLQQALRAARLSGADETQQFSIMQYSLSLLRNLPSGVNPPEIGYHIHQIVSDMVDVQDPYQAVKAASTRQALALYNRLKDMVQQSEDPLGLAIRLSIAGNIIDFALNDQIDDLWQTVERVIRQPYAVDDSKIFLERLKMADHLLYLADNAGETVFDRILIEALPVPVIYVVKSHPYVNDATMADALAAGLDRCAKLMENGAQAAGTILKLCSPEFRACFEKAPLILAKGQANFETLSDAGARVFCLLQVKCPMIAVDLGVPVGSIVTRQCGIESG